MTAACLRVAASATLLAGLSGLAAAQADRLRHDPFQRPPLSAMRQSSPPAPVAPPEQVVAPEKAEARWTPALKAVMLAGHRSIANLDGLMLRIGDTINGYVLVQVRQQEAVLAKDGEQLTVTLSSRADEPGLPRGEK